MPPLILWMRTQKPKDKLRAVSARAETQVTYTEPTLNQARVTTATHLQHRFCEFGFCTFIFLQKVHKNMFYVWTHSKLIKIKVVLDGGAWVAQG